MEEFPLVDYFCRIVDAGQEGKFIGFVAFGNFGVAFLQQMFLKSASSTVFKDVFAFELGFEIFIILLDGVGFKAVGKIF